MPGDPRQCRLNAARCLALANRVRKPEARQIFIEMAETWNRLASLTECDQTLFQAISEIELGEPYDALPNALRLRLGEYALATEREGSPSFTQATSQKKPRFEGRGLSGTWYGDVAVGGRAASPPP